MTEKCGWYNGWCVLEKGHTQRHKGLSLKESRRAKLSPQPQPVELREEPGKLEGTRAACDDPLCFGDCHPIRKPSMATGDAADLGPLREDTITFRYDGMEAVTHACGLLDVIKLEWEWMWTEHDQAVRDGLSRMLTLYAKETEQASKPSLSPEMTTALELLREYREDHKRPYDAHECDGDDNCPICRKLDESGFLEER